MPKLPPIRRIDKYAIEFTSYRSDVGHYYQNLLEAYENQDLDRIEEYGKKLTEAMLENAAEILDDIEEEKKKPDADYLYDRMIDRQLEEKI